MNDRTETATPADVKAPPIPQSTAGAVAERQTRALAPSSAIDAKTGGLMAALIDAVRDPNIAIERMRELHQLYRDISAVEQEKLFLDALARCQASLDPVRRSLKNTHTNSMYASLAAIQREVMPKMAAEGLSLTFETDKSPLGDGFVRVVGVLAHREGHKQRYTRDLPLDNAGAKGNTNKTDIQAYQSTVSYATRGLYKQIFALAEEGDDKDGNRPPPVRVAMTDEHQRILDDTCAGISPTVKGAVLREYKAKSFAEIPDSEYESIARRLAKTAAEKAKAAKP